MATHVCLPLLPESYACEELQLAALGRDTPIPESALGELRCRLR
jgi:hypothetical protein